MPKFKVGDKVRILDGSKIEDYAGGWAIFGGMNKYIGTIQTIEKVDEDWSDGRVSYHMEDIVYSWDERGLELVPKFKVGDRVRAKKEAPYSITTDGWIGEVVKVYDNSYSDEDIRVFGEDALGSKENKNGFSVESKYFDLVEDSENKIVITTDGKTTTAVLYNGKQRIKSAKAKCAPSDTFDFNIGASIALERLIRQACGKKADAVYIDEGFKSQMDKFMTGDIVIKVPDGKTMDFLKELEKKNEKLRWHAGQKPTEWGHRCKYFSIDRGGLGYIDKCDLHMVHRPVEIWDDVESTSDVPHAIRAIAAFEALMKLMKDEFDD